MVKAKRRYIPIKIVWGSRGILDVLVLTLRGRQIQTEIPVHYADAFFAARPASKLLVSIFRRPTRVYYVRTRNGPRRRRGIAKERVILGVRSVDGLPWPEYRLDCAARRGGAVNGSTMATAKGCPWPT